MHARVVVFGQASRTIGIVADQGLPESWGPEMSVRPRIDSKGRRRLSFFTRGHEAGLSSRCAQDMVVEENNGGDSMTTSSERDRVPGRALSATDDHGLGCWRVCAVHLLPPSSRAESLSSHSRTRTPDTRLPTWR